jgi:glycosyltransferase involved in cell wall biosynthesis
LYEPNAVDVEEFSRATGGAIRKKLAVPTGSILICYSGALRTMGMEKGIDTLLDALALLPPRFRLLVVGGSADDVSVYRNRARQLHVSDRVFFTGWLRHQEVREYLAASDILVAPFPKTPHYDLYMSPMKLFEYMAVGKPIVASRLRSICEIVDERSAFLVTPGDVTALSHGIAVASSDDSAGERVQRAYETVREHGWHKRATRLLRFLLDAQ